MPSLPCANHKNIHYFDKNVDNEENVSDYKLHSVLKIKAFPGNNTLGYFIVPQETSEIFIFNISIQDTLPKTKNDACKKTERRHI